MYPRLNTRTTKLKKLNVIVIFYEVFKTNDSQKSTIEEIYISGFRNLQCYMKQNTMLHNGFNHSQRYVNHNTMLHN